MAIIDISQIKEYGEKYGEENFSPKLKKIIKELKNNIDKIYVTNSSNSSEKKVKKQFKQSRILNPTINKKMERKINFCNFIYLGYGIYYLDI